MYEELTKVKEVQIEIMEQFRLVCEKLNLRWYAGYGTALGAIRHQGFIPWDDDIDVTMPRKDYEIFCKEAQKILPENYFVQNLETEKEYYQPFAKLRKSDTTFWEIGTKDDNINHGVYIDVFPLDGYPESKLTEVIYMAKRVVYDNFLYQNGDVNQLTGYRKIFGYVYKVLRGSLSKREAGIKKEKLAFVIPYDEAELVSCLVTDTPKAEAVPSSVYGAGREVPFEHTMICVPEQCEFYLEKLFGNYMQFPPEDQRVPLHSCIVIDTEKSYLEYQK